ncbi:MAG: PaREP1 family protein [Candidatus Njordarchaeales archaeon]
MDIIDDLVMEAKKSYEDALRLLNRGDYYDSAEKAWRAIEYLRKAVLVAAKIPYEKAKTVSIGLPLFSDLLRGLGEKRALDLYDKLAYKLHVMGFYEEITQPDEIEELIMIDVKELMEALERLLETAKRLDLRRALEKLMEIQRMRREIAKYNAKIVEMRSKYKDTLHTALKALT